MSWRVACWLAILLTHPALASDDAQSLYLEHWTSCHGASRLGAIGPALLPENLDPEESEAQTVVSQGRASTQVPAFADELRDEEIEQVTDLIYRGLRDVPHWGLDEIRASQVAHVKPGEKLADQPMFEADPLNLFIVVESGDHHVTLLDGERFEPIARFPTRFALRGSPKYSPDGRFVYFASRDGWISKYDIWNLRYVAEIRAGVLTRDLAVSGDGRYVMVGNDLPHTLVVLDAEDLSPLKVIEAKSRQRKSSRVAAVYDAAPRKSFIAVFEDIPEIWEMTYDDDAAPVYEGLVHDFRMGEGIPVPGPFPPRRIVLTEVLHDFFFEPSYAQLVGASREGGMAQVVDLDVRRRIASVDTSGMPHLTSGITWDHDGRRILATLSLEAGAVSLVDMDTWKTVERIETLGPGCFMRSHEKTPYAWADNMMSKDKDTIQVIDKQTLEVVKALRPVPEKTAAHVEFTRDGKHALLSIWEMDGALIVYDAETLEEVKRLPMKKPSGKYNVHNEITRSSGTSH
jgi:DNA-binding beta-propeller fold protein YncE